MKVISRLTGTWFPFLVLLAALLPLGGARSPYVFNTLLLLIGTVSSVNIARLIHRVGAADAARDLFSGIDVPLLLALPALVLFQILIDATVGLSHGPRLAMIDSELWLSMLAVFFIAAASACSTERSFHLMLAGLVLAGTLEALYGVLNLLAGNEYILIYERHKYFDSVTGTFYSRNQFAYLMELTIPPSAAFGAIFAVKGRSEDGRRSEETEELARKLLIGAALVTMGIALLLSRSRMGVLSLTIATGVVFGFNALVRPRNTKSDRLFPAGILIGALIATLVAALLGAGALLDRFLEFDADMLSGRGPLWKATLDMAMAKPLIGHGWGTYEALIPAYRSGPTGVYFDHAHNEYLEVFAEAGIAGLAIVAMLVFAFLRRAIRTLESPLSNLQRTTVLALTTSVLSVLLHSIADFGLRIPGVVIPFLMVLAMFLNITRNPGIVDSDFNGRA